MLHHTLALASAVALVWHFKYWIQWPTEFLRLFNYSFHTGKKFRTILHCSTVSPTGVSADSRGVAKAASWTLEEPKLPKKLGRFTLVMPIMTAALSVLLLHDDFRTSSHGCIRWLRLCGYFWHLLHIVRKGVFVAELMKRANLQVRQVINHAHDIHGPMKVYMRKRIESLLAAGIKLPNFGTFEKAVSLIFLDFVVQNAAGLLLSPEFSRAW